MPYAPKVTNVAQELIEAVSRASRNTGAGKGDPQKTREAKETLRRYIERLEKERQELVEKFMDDARGWWKCAEESDQIIRETWAKHGGPGADDADAARSPLETLIRQSPTLYRLALMEWTRQNPRADTPHGTELIDHLLAEKSNRTRSNERTEIARDLCLHPRTAKKTTWRGTETVWCEICGATLDGVWLYSGGRSAPAKAALRVVG